MGEKMTEIKFENRAERDSMVEALNTLDSEIYGVIMDRSEYDISPGLFQGYSKITSVNKVSMSDGDIYELKPIISFKPIKYFYEGRYRDQKSCNNEIYLDQNGVLFLGDKDVIEALYHEEYANVKTRKALASKGEKL